MRSPSDLRTSSGRFGPAFRKSRSLSSSTGLRAPHTTLRLALAIRTPTRPPGTHFRPQRGCRYARIRRAAFSAFTVTKAHRDTDGRSAADIENSGQSARYLGLRQEIRLVGVAPEGGTPSTMSDAELGALGAFMNSGGGVFATGDHEDLGVIMCGRVPRVARHAQVVLSLSWP